MNKHKISIVLLALLLVGMLMSCSNKTPSQTITSIEMEIPTGDVQLTENGYAVFAGRTYSGSKDFAVRGYINNGQSYSYVNATVYAQKTIEENAKAEKVVSGFKFATDDIYNVWAEYNGMKSQTIKVSAYEANVVFDASFSADTLNKNYEYGDLIKLVSNAKFYTEAGSLRSTSGADIPSLRFLFVDTETIKTKEINKDSSEKIDSKDFNSLIIYSEANCPFFIFSEVKIYDPATDLDSIALNTVRIDWAGKSLKGLAYAARFNGTTIARGISPFEDDTTKLKAGHKITIAADGIETKIFNEGQSVSFEFEAKKTYKVTLSVKVGENEYSAYKNITFSK